MKYPLQLYIGDQRVDMFDDESVTIKQSVKDLSAPDKIFTDFSRQFTVPASKLNNKIFKHYHNAHIVGGIDARTLLDATLYLKDEVYKVGTVNIEGVQMRNGKPFAYKIFFLGNLSQIKKSIGEDYLTDLNLTACNINDPDYQDIIQNAAAADAVKFPLISRDHRYIAHSTNALEAQTLGLENTKNIHYVDNTVNTAYYGVLASDLVGALKVDKILDAIETKYGFNFEGVLGNANYIRDLHLMLQKKREKDLSETKKFLFQNLTPTNSNAKWFNTNSYLQFYNETERSSRHRIKTTITTELTSFKVILKTGSTVIWRFTEAGWPYIEDPDGHLFWLIYANGPFTWELETAQAGEVRIDVEVNGIYPNDISGTFTGSVNTAIDGQDYIINNNIPKMKVLDFLTSLFKQFNIIATVDKDLNVSTKHYDYFLSEGNTYEIDEYVDSTKHSVNRPNRYSGMAFAYKEEKTILEQGYIQSNGQKYGEIEYFIKEDANHLTGEAYKTELPLQRIPYERLTDLSNGTLSGIQYALLADDEGKEQQCAPLFTYLTKRTTGSDVAFTEATTTQLSSYWFPQNVYTENTLQEEPALVGNYFGDEIDEFQISTRYNGLDFFNLFWFGITRLMFEPDKRSVTHEAYLPLKILRKLTLADRFIINGNLHLIESIETNYLSGKSKLKLIRIKPEDLEDFQENQTTITPTGTTYVNYIGTDGKVKHQTLTSQTTITHIGKIKRQL